MPGHDMIVVGASAGGIEALIQFVQELPAQLPAAIFVVVHVPSHGISRLPEILTRSGPLPARHARHGETIEHGRIYVAPPDFHLVVRAGYMELGHGPRENHVRPAIDPLFRSAARAFGPRVVGVVLSGSLSDGSTGMMIIKAYGGVCIVQDPEEALFGGMPRSILQFTAADQVLPVRQIPNALSRLAREPVTEKGAMDMRDPAETANQMIQQDLARQAQDRRGDESSVYTCPDCGGVLWQIQNGQVEHFQCHVGHAYGPDSLLQSQSEALELALWSCVRMLREKATLMCQFATRARQQGDEVAAQRYDEQAQLHEQHFDAIQEMLLETRIDATA